MKVKERREENLMVKRGERERGGQGVGWDEDKREKNVKRKMINTEGR